MHSKKPESGLQTDCERAIKTILREAKKLHKAAASDSHMRALPVLRRLISTQAIRDISLPDLRKNQEIIQRKHILHMLALEAGFASWNEYRKDIEAEPVQAMQRYCAIHRDAGTLNLWFSSLAEAESYVSEHGGSPVAFGSQAVVLSGE